MKILIVMGGYFPGKKYGGPPVSVSNFCSLMHEHECFIITTNHDLGEKNAYKNLTDGWNVRENCKVRYLSDEEYNIKSFRRSICDIQPDVIYLQGFFQKCVLPCLYLARKYKVRVVLAPRGELCAGALNIKKYKKLPYIVFVRLAKLIKNVTFQSTSEEETDAICSYLNVPYEKIHLLANIPSMPSKKFIRSKKIAGEGRFVFLSRIHPKKNLLSAIKYFERVKGRVYFDIYGPIEDNEYWSQCQEAFSKLPSNVSVMYKGLVSHEEVHEVFSRYDAFLFPTFSENYGHVIAEAMLAETPVIISDQTPWTDIMGYEAGFAYPLEDSWKFVCAIQQMVDVDQKEFARMQERLKEYMNVKLQLENMKSSYNKVF